MLRSNERDLRKFFALTHSAEVRYQNCAIKKQEALDYNEKLLEQSNWFQEGSLCNQYQAGLNNCVTFLKWISINHEQNFIFPRMCTDK